MQIVFVACLFFGIPMSLLLIGTIVQCVTTGECLCQIEIPHSLKNFIIYHRTKRHLEVDGSLEHMLNV